MGESEIQAEEAATRWIDRIERLKIKLALLAFLFIGISTHFITLYLSEGGIHFYSFIEKTADAIIIASVIGITYEWYASQSRLNLLRKEIQDIVRTEEKELRNEVHKLNDTLEALADENTAAFSLISPSQIEKELREKIEVCNEIKCMGDFQVAEDGEEDVIEDFIEYTGNNIEGYIHKRIRNTNDDFKLLRIYPHRDEDLSWVEEHKPLLDHTDIEESSEYHLLPHPHDVEYPIPSFMIIDDHNTPGGDLLVLAIPEKEGIVEQYQKQILLYTEDEKVINAFETYFTDIWDHSKALNSAEELDKVGKELGGAES